MHTFIPLLYHTINTILCIIDFGGCFLILNSLKGANTFKITSAVGLILLPDQTSPKILNFYQIIPGKTMLATIIVGDNL